MTRVWETDDGTNRRILRSKSQIPLRYPGRRQVRDWSQTCSELGFGISARASRSATSFGPVCDQNGVMEFGFKTANQPATCPLDMGPRTEVDVNENAEVVHRRRWNDSVRPNLECAPWQLMLSAGSGKPEQLRLNNWRRLDCIQRWTWSRYADRRCK